MEESDKEDSGRKSANILKSILNSKVKSIVKSQSDRLRRKWRKLVTGDESKRVRDVLKDNEGKPKFVMFMDEVSFTLGVLNIAVTQYFLFNRPENFWMWYSAMMPLLMIVRRWNFKKMGWQYFLLDFCYFTFWSTLLSLFVIRQSPTFFKCIFLYANGPLTFAILLWRNSFVFHDYEKMTSVYLHLYPCLLTYALRWHDKGLPGYSYAQQPMCWGDLWAACGGYLLWQVLYYVKTEVFDREKLDSNPKLITSLRWLSASKKNWMSRLVLKACRSVGLFGPKEEYDSKTFKTKLVYMVSQFMYTLFTFLPIPLLYRWQWIHLMYIIFIFTMAVYYGASYYIEVFSARYQKQFETSNHIQQVAETAAKAAYSMAQLNRSLASEDSLKRHGVGSPSPGSKGAVSPIPVGQMKRVSNDSANDIANSIGDPIVGEGEMGARLGRENRANSRTSIASGSRGGSKADLKTLHSRVPSAADLLDVASDWDRAREAEAHDIIEETTTAFVEHLIRDRTASDDMDTETDESDTEDGGSSRNSLASDDTPGINQVDVSGPIRRDSETSKLHTE